MRFFILILFFVISYPLYANNSYNTAEVDKFINEMFKKHNYEKDNLKKLFSSIQEEKKLNQFFKSAPERRLTWNGCEVNEKQCINYKRLFVNEKNIKNGLLFMSENHVDLNKASSIFGIPREIITAIIGIETRYGKSRKF